MGKHLMYLVHENKCYMLPTGQLLKNVLIRVCILILFHCNYTIKIQLCRVLNMLIKKKATTLLLSEQLFAHRQTV